jgi:hypothetical protein
MLQKWPCSSAKKYSWPTISIRLFAFITSRDTRGKPSGSTRLAERNEDTGVMLRVGELDTEEKVRSCRGERRGIEETDVPSGGVVGIAVTGRETIWEAALSRSRTPSASLMMRLAMFSNISRILTMAFVALRQSRPAIAIRAYVRLAPRDRGSLRRKT